MADPKNITPGCTFAEQLKKLIEALGPDIRKYYRPSLQGRVVKVHDDDSDELYYRVDIVVGGDENGEGGLALPDVPVQSAWAMNGYGLFALPEEGAEVIVAFEDGDATRPYVQSPIFVSNAAPDGFKAGTFAIRGRNGQKIELKADSNEIVVAAGSLKIITSLLAQRLSAGDDRRLVYGDQETTIDGLEKYSAGSLDATVSEKATVRLGSLDLATDGSLKETIGGLKETTITGGEKTSVGGGSAETILGEKKMLVGNSLQIFVGNTGYAKGDLNAINIIAGAGSINIDTTLGTGFINLGGAAATGQGAVNGPALKGFLTTLITALQGTLGKNVAGPLITDEKLLGTLSALLLTTEALISKKVNISLI